MAKKPQKQVEKKETRSDFLVGTRGRIFEGFVTKKFPTRVVIEFERTIYVQKYKSFYKKQTRLHARLPEGMDINVGDYIQIRECRPLSKIIHFMVVKKVRSPQNIKEAKA
ncbi:30S ribosomal protein S17 [Candidatus Pacearchaeota archaeon]|nr:30S ribosomal protein S17 [Candidatus Pacearchaeota archaeon]